MKLSVKLSFLGFVSLLPSAALADWRVAESSLLQVYSEDDEETLRTAVRDIEIYHRLLKAFSQTKKEASPLKLKVFLVRDMKAVAATLPYPSYGVGGYYSATERGPFLVATRRGEKAANTRRTAVDTTGNWGPKVLQHEYAHHFMYQYFPGLYPTWYSEGFAEYYGSMDFLANNVIEVGHAPFFRMQVINSGWYPMRKLLTAKSYADVGDNIRNLYAQGWLLTHYAASNTQRGKQLKEYLVAVASGTKYEDAAKAAFGDDLDKLDEEMKAHAKKLSAIRIPLKPMDVGEIKVRKLTAAEEALLQTEIRLNAGFRRADLSQYIDTARSVVSANPGDGFALSTLMETEYLAGDLPGTIKSADKLLAMNSRNPVALMYKGKALIDQLQAAKSNDETAWDAARAMLLEAKKLDPNSAQARMAFYDSYDVRGILPPAEAQNDLMRAHQLVPRDSDIRYKLALDFERRGFIEDAMYIIAPDAFGSLDGDEKRDERKKLKDKKELERAAKTYTFITARETAKEMYDRLAAKKEPDAAPPTKS
jgi:hypothetical protein